MEENSNALIADEGGEEREFVEEGSEILQIVQRVIATEGKDAEQVYDRWKQILYKYQEQSQLLDAFLEDIVVPLSSLLRQHAVESEAKDSELQKIQGTCRMLSVLVVVRGYKTVVKFFPHEAQDLEKVLMVFTTVKARSKVVKTEEEAVAVWESQSILLLWLSMLILVPFDLATIDSSATDMTAARSQPYTQLVSKIMTICQECLHQPGSVREMGALLLGRMLTRPDMGLALGEYIAWIEGAPNISQ
ncbi:hypothetical protein CEUSTIGMA_g1515.t1 [Chlamydomonas eustigma]|uniref:Uncharacterized protein n=1 Tax=Chlamydomonas eustigma TaxID=1157962 RepID=A0A250WTD0_9CHLO|nr:hypothetical protein CEUSTIGMA_g1515.t1 [Chlamydomonas eustigma]|eukprot:GAX74065.1 hypothetical protein CEUSTIGMA_g1515.t1 [Chlamydomonas eustigma]